MTDADNTDDLELLTNIPVHGAFCGVMGIVVGNGHGDTS